MLRNQATLRIVESDNFKTDHKISYGWKKAQSLMYLPKKKFEGRPYYKILCDYSNREDIGLRLLKG